VVGDVWDVAAAGGEVEADAEADDGEAGRGEPDGAWSASNGFEPWTLPDMCRQEATASVAATKIINPAILRMTTRSSTVPRSQ
jgi:hypothetical protein